MSDGYEITASLRNAVIELVQATDTGQPALMNWLHRSSSCGPSFVLPHERRAIAELVERSGAAHSGSVQALSQWLSEPKEHQLSPEYKRLGRGMKL